MDELSFDLFLPCRKGSKRVIKKNSRPFCKKNKSLLQVKLEQLIKIKEINKIILSTDDIECINIAEDIKKINKILFIDKRPSYLAEDNTNLKDLIKYAYKISSSKHIIWTHVTSPFFESSDYAQAIKIYKENVIENKKYDSLLSGIKLQKYIFSVKENDFINASNDFWPSTQTLNDHISVDSAIFIASRDFFKEGKRIGFNPYILINSEKKGYDIDTELDFRIASLIYKSQL